MEDRELTDAHDDRFEHQRIADQIVELATIVEAPTNIALYGPWGSGKSGIANLVKSRLRGGQRSTVRSFRRVQVRGESPASDVPDSCRERARRD
ncbi:P-loop NTPase fold protein [Amycolatopsis sp. A133]|uniref:P-loop NTPase fold protein n=1 Tax=Amycolatopsis sp. A133 TaxID=3064472 RepID=UPI0027E6FE3F|nr:P-loop NTPase fold protein [Amycolatopsis sp. A133]MDQ7809382.1 P-loop NTPase fold protein [Amycolatopsis sp. A133]